MNEHARILRGTAIIHAGALAAGIGLVECLLLVLGGRFPTIDAAVYVTLFAAVSYFFLGLGIAALGRFLRRVSKRPAEGSGDATLVLAVLLAFLVIDRAELNAFDPSGSGLFKFIAGILLAVVIAVGAARWFRRAFPRLDRAPWLPVAVGLFAATLLAISLQFSKGRGASPALALAIAALLMSIAPFFLKFKQRVLFGSGAFVTAVGSAYLLEADLAFQRDASRGSPPSVLLITLDTTRADHLGCYGYNRAATPHLDSFASSGCRFTDAVSNSVETGPSHMTILSGRLIHEHGALRNGIKIAESIETLPDVLRAAGYRTAAFVSGWTVTDRMTGLGQRFDHYDDDLNRFKVGRDEVFSLQVWRMVQNFARSWEIRFVRNDRPAAWTTDRALAWLRENGEHPFFVWLHYFDPHLPYEAPSNYDTVRDGPHDWYGLSGDERAALVQSPGGVARMIARYDAEIAYMDDQLGRVLRYVEAQHPPSSLLTIITADHGESMGEHGIYWGRRLYEPSLHVPLLIRAPGIDRQACVDEQQTSHVDLFPTIMEVLRLRTAYDGPGESLLGRIRGDTHPEPTTAVANRFVRDGDTGEMWSIRRDGRKLIWSGAYIRNVFRIPAKEELYDLRADQAESVNLIGRLSEVTGAFRSLLEAYRKSRDTTARPLDTQDPDALERLRTLGYVGD